MIPEPMILIFDAEAASQQALRAMVCDLQYAVETCTTPAEVQEAYDPSRPGCLIYHLHQPGAPGLTAFSQIRQDRPELPVIVVSEHGDVPTVVAAMKAGAQTFFKKPCREAALAEALAEALRIHTLKRKRHALRAKIRRRLEKLTPGESALLELLVAGKSNREAAEKLCLSVRAIEQRRAKIMKTLQAGSFAELIAMTLIAGPEWVPDKYHLSPGID